MFQDENWKKFSQLISHICLNEGVANC